MFATSYSDPVIDIYDRDSLEWKVGFQGQMKGVQYGFVKKQGDRNFTLQSYNYSRNVNNHVGSFSFTFVEAVGTDSLIDKIGNLDIVEISDVTKFIGVVTSVAVGAVADGARNISINGKSCEYLLDMLNLSIDESAMSFFLGEKADISTTVELCKVAKASDGSSVRKALDTDLLLKTVWGKFCETTSDSRYRMIASWAISRLILFAYSKTKKQEGEIADVAKLKFWNRSGEDSVDFLYPVSCQLFRQNNVKFVEYIKNIMPNPVYEIFGKFDSKAHAPSLVIREAPFMPASWVNLPLAVIPPDFVTTYNFKKSIDEVYTAFFPYLSGSVERAEFYKNLSSSVAGQRAAAKDAEKIKYFGYKPLTCNFVGFPRPSSETEKKEMNNAVATEFPKLAEKMRDMFGSMDEMYSGEITVINNDKMKKMGVEKWPDVGERLQIGRVQFYVDAVKTQWHYGQPTTLNYSLSRGGLYSAEGKFSQLDKFNNLLKDMEKK